MKNYSVSAPNMDDIRIYTNNGRRLVHECQGSSEARAFCLSLEARGYEFERYGTDGFSTTERKYFMKAAK